MSYLLIDPPVTPFSKPDRISAWIAELDTMIADGVEDGQPREAVEEARKQAVTWLSVAIDVHKAISNG